MITVTLGLLACRRSPTASHALSPIALAVALSALGACGGSNTPQTPTPTTTQKIIEVYTGRLNPGGSGFYSFQVRTAETANYTFASLTQVGSGRALDVALTLGVGVPAGEDCNVSNSTLAAPGLSPQLSSGVAPGIYCLRLSDPGALTAAANFAVRIQHP